MASAEPEARQRNEQLVAQLQSSRVLRDPAVAGAFRAVLRHHFLPGRPLDEVYEDAAIMTKVGERGLPVSSSSQPTIMAIMLQLLSPRRGQRVLEIGAGTGYNAALIAHLVGPAGHVVTVDIDQEVADRARANLAEAGVEDVEVVLADGSGGWPAGAPYDRLIVTASADDLAPAWLDQLDQDGRLVVPLTLAGPGQLCAAFVRRGRSLASSALCQCGFLPLRGDMASGPAPVEEDLARWLGEDGRPTGHVVPLGDLRGGFDTWLGLTEDGYVRVRTMADEAVTFGLRDDQGVAVVVGDDGDHQVLAFGDGEAAGARLAAAHSAWARERPSLDRLRIVAFPRGEEQPLRAVRVVRRPRFTFVVRSG